jgi:hypothetical protein
MSSVTVLGGGNTAFAVAAARFYFALEPGTLCICIGRDDAFGQLLRGQGAV